MPRCGIFLAILVLSLSCGIVYANMFNVVYSVEKGQYQYCDGEAKYELRITVTNLESEKIEGIIEPYLLIGKDVIHPCYPSYWKRVFRTEAHGTDEAIFYFRDFPSSATLSVVLEFNGNSEVYYFPIKEVTTTVLTTPELTSTPSERSFSIDRFLMPIYESYFQPLAPYIRYEYFRILIFAIPVALAGGSLAVLKIKRKREYGVEIPVEYCETGRSFKLFANCAECGKREYMPFKCNYCGEYFCGEHILPTKHNCPGLDAWKEKKPPGSGISWEYRTDGTYYRKY